MEIYTKYELARLIGARALQLSYGAPPFVKIISNDTPIEIAHRELMERVLPIFVVKNNGEAEI